MRCYDCGVLDGRDHHYDCESWEARKQRRAWEREAERDQDEMETQAAMFSPIWVEDRR